MSGILSLMGSSFPKIPLQRTKASSRRSVFEKFSPGGEGVLPYMSYIGMCGPKGNGFSAVLVINRVSILAYLDHFGHK